VEDFINSVYWDGVREEYICKIDSNIKPQAIPGRTEQEVP
jgi:hypothetical protein